MRGQGTARVDNRAGTSSIIYAPCENEEVSYGAQESSMISAFVVL